MFAVAMQSLWGVMQSEVLLGETFLRFQGLLPLAPGTRPSPMSSLDNG